MRREKRRVALKRRTRGTEVEIELRLDGSGRTAIDTPFTPLNELLTLMAAHSGLDLRLVQLLNRHADDPYAIDDLATGLAEGFRRAVGLRPRVRQFASAIVPVGDALVLAAVDLVSPPVFVFGATFNGGRSGDMDPALIERFLGTFMDRLGASLHLRVLAGAHEENRMRAVFIALGRCLSEACLEMDRDGAREVALDLDYTEGTRRPPSGDEALDEAVIEELEPIAEVDGEPALRAVPEARPRRGERGRGREGRESRDDREGRESRDDREGRESREVREGRESREVREGRESREGREGRESREGREGREGRERGRGERGRRRELPSRTAPAASGELEMPPMHLESPVEEFAELGDLPELADYPELAARDEATPVEADGEFGEGEGEGEGRTRRRRRGRRGGRGRRRDEREPAPAEAGAGDAIVGEGADVERVAIRRSYETEETEAGREEEEAFVPAFPRGRSGARDAGRPGRGEHRRGSEAMRADHGDADDEIGSDIPGGERVRADRGDEAHDDEEAFTPGPIDRVEPARGGRGFGRRSGGDLTGSAFRRGRKGAVAARPQAEEKPLESNVETGEPFAREEEDVAPLRSGPRGRSAEESEEAVPAEEGEGVLDFISRPTEPAAPDSPRAMARTRRRRR